MEIILNDFDKWNIKKQVIQTRPGSAAFKERDIWWCSLGHNIGSEENGKHEEFERPVLVFRIFSPQNLWVIPLTSREVISMSRKECSIILNEVARTLDISQLRMISSKRLIRYMDAVSYSDFQKIRSIFIDLG